MNEVDVGMKTIVHHYRGANLKATRVAVAPVGKYLCSPGEGVDV